MDDTSTLARAQRGMEGLVAGQQAQLQDTKEALLRSAQVRFMRFVSVFVCMCVRACMCL